MQILFHMKRYENYRYDWWKFGTQFSEERNGLEVDVFSHVCFLILPYSLETGQIYIEEQLMRWSCQNVIKGYATCQENKQMWEGNKQTKEKKL